MSDETRKFAVLLIGCLFSAIAGLAIGDAVGRATAGPPEHVTIDDFSSGYPVRVEIATGKVSELRWGQWREIGAFDVHPFAPCEVHGVSLVEEWQAEVQ